MRLLVIVLVFRLPVYCSCPCDANVAARLLCSCFEFRRSVPFLSFVIFNKAGVRYDTFLGMFFFALRSRALLQLFSHFCLSLTVFRSHCALTFGCF